MDLFQTLKKLAEKTGVPLELRPGLNVTALGEVRLDMKIHRAEENRWYNVEGERGPK